jgi:hypothetical protein
LVETLSISYLGSGAVFETFALTGFTNLVSVLFRGASVSGEGPSLNNIEVRVDAVPEPSTLTGGLLATMAFGGAVWLRRRLSA